MLRLSRRQTEISALVLFRGTIPPRAHEIEVVLLGNGIAVQAGRSSDEMQWCLRATHAQWGKAEVWCPRDLERLDDVDLLVARHLFDDERSAIAACTVGVRIRLACADADALTERKNLLRFAHAVMGEDGIAVRDEVSGLIWPAEIIKDEMRHDAPCDIDHLYCYHAVLFDEEESKAVAWLHTHGLAEIGFFDFDILRPDASLYDGEREHLRALVWMILEGQANPDDVVQLAGVGGHAWLADADGFQRSANPSDAALRDDPGRCHLKDRVVLCDPHRGRLSRWFSRPRPCRWMSLPQNIEDVVPVSLVATNIMADRARQSVPMFKRYLEEFADLQVVGMVKLGYESQGREVAREHLWFEVHGIACDQIDATLLNRPIGVRELHQGDRGVHDLDRLSDWVVASPAGNIRTCNSHPARLLRRYRGDLLKHQRAANA